MTGSNHIGPRAGRISGLEVLRGYAAVAVILLHFEVLGFQHYEGILKTSVWTAGRWGVPLFFALSAFSLLYGYQHRLADEGGLLRFFVRRAFRICPFFYVMIAAWLLARPGASVSDIVLNLTFLFPLVPAKAESIVPAGWSLGIEWFFYWTFPVFSLIARSIRASAILLIVFMIVNMATWTILPELGMSETYTRLSVLRSLVFFQAGIFAFSVISEHGFHISKTRSSAIMVATAVALLVCAASMGATTPDVGIVALCMLWVACAYAGLPSWIDNPVTRFLGRVSYSLYLVHPLVIVLLVQAGFYASLKSVFGNGYVGFLAGATATVLIASIVSAVTYRLIESPGIRLGEWFLTRTTSQGRREPRQTRAPR